MTILKVEHLSKTYKTGKQALVDLNFAVQDGEILGFLGPNGAGKSTTINIISTLLKADSGTIVYFNNPQMPRKEVKQKLGIVPKTLRFMRISLPTKTSNSLLHFTASTAKRCVKRSKMH